jgi:hypothetical protein
MHHKQNHEFYVWYVPLHKTAITFCIWEHFLAYNTKDDNEHNRLNFSSLFNWFVVPYWTSRNKVYLIIGISNGKTFNEIVSCSLQLLMYGIKL